MPNYVSQTSDKSKKKAIIRLLIGGIGLHYFYVGRIKHGVIRMIISLFLWGVIVTSISEGVPQATDACIILLVAINLFDLARLCLGKFQDNAGQYLRQ